MGIRTSFTKFSAVTVAALAVFFAASLLTVPAADAAAPGQGAAEERQEAQPRRALVRAVQQKLKDNGYNPGPIDGVMGGMTKSSLYAYQRHHGLPVDGKLNAPTLRSLGLK